MLCLYQAGETEDESDTTVKGGKGLGPSLCVKMDAEWNLGERKWEEGEERGGGEFGPSTDQLSDHVGEFQHGGGRRKGVWK